MVHPNLTLNGPFFDNGRPPPDPSTTSIPPATTATTTELEKLFNKQSSISQEDQHISDLPIDKLMEKSIVSIKNWISCYKPLIASSEKQAKHHATSKCRTLTAYFP